MSILNIQIVLKNLKIITDSKSCPEKIKSLASHKVLKREDK